MCSFGISQSQKPLEFWETAWSLKIINTSSSTSLKTNIREIEEKGFSLTFLVLANIFSAHRYVYKQLITMLILFRSLLIHLILRPLWLWWN